MAASELCTTWSCPLVSRQTGRELAAFGVVWAVLVAASYWVLRKVEFKISRLFLYFRYEWKPEWGQGRVWVRILMAAVATLVSWLPLPYLVAWSIFTYFQLRDSYKTRTYPAASAFTIALGCTCLLLLGYGYRHWRRESFRLTTVPRACLACVLCVYFVLQLCFIFVVLESYESAFIVLVSYNMLCVMLSAYLRTYRASALSFSRFLHIKDVDITNDNTALERRDAVRRWGFLSYAVGVLILILFALLVDVEFHTKVGWAIFLSITGCDVALFWHDIIGLTTSPVKITLLSALSRVLLFVWGRQRWYFGVCVNYVLYASLLIYHAVDAQYELFTREQAVEKALEEVASKERSGEGQASARESRYGQIGEFLPRLCCGRRNLLPYLAVAVITVFFVASIVAAFIVDQQDSSSRHLFERISVFPGGKEHGQYQFGLFTLLITLSSTAALVAYRRFAIADFKYSHAVLMQTIAFLVFSIGGSQLLAWSTGSNAILALGIFLPLIAVSATVTYVLYRENNYRWNSYEEDLKRKRRMVKQSSDGGRQSVAADEVKDPDDAPRRIDVAADGQAAGAKDPDKILDIFKRSRMRLRRIVKDEIRSAKDDTLALPKLVLDFVMGRHNHIDYSIFFAALLTGIFCFLVGVTFGVREHNSASGGIMGAGFGLAILTFFTINTFVNTFKFGKITLSGLGAVLIVMGVFLDRANVRPFTVIIGVVLLYPALLILLLALYAWRLRGYKAPVQVQGAVLLSYILALTFAIMVWISVKRLTVGLGLVLLVSTAAAGVGMLLWWGERGFSLPVKVKTAFSFTAIAVWLVISLSFFLSQGVYWLYGITPIFIGFFVLLAQSALSNLRENETWRLFPSKFIFPVFAYDPSAMQTRQSLETANKGPFALLAACVLLMVWGLMFALVRTPSFVGWIVFSVGMLTIWGFLLRLALVPVAAFWEAWSVLCRENKDTGLIRKARNAAIAAELPEDDHDIVKGISDAPAGIAPPVPEDDEKQEASRNSAKAQLDLYRVFWRWMESSDISAMLRRRQAKMKRVREKAQCCGEASAEEVRRELQEVRQIDLSIRRAFEEQSRMVVRFMLMVIAAAEALYKQHVARLKEVFDFICEDVKDVDLRNMGPQELKAWIVNNKDLLESANRTVTKAREMERKKKHDREAEEASAQMRQAVAVAASDDVKESELLPADQRKELVLQNPRKCEEWLRESKVDPALPLFGARNVVSSDDVKQGDLGDCFLLSAATVLAQSKPRIIKSMIEHCGESDGHRVFRVHFVVAGQRTSVTVTEQLVFKVNQGIKRPMLAYAQVPPASSAMWLPVLEKAYAKLYRGFSQIEGGLVHRALADLTGGVTEMIKTSEGGSESINLEAASGLWHRLLRYHREGYLMGCGNPTGKGLGTTLQDSNSQGIMQGHAYALLRLVEVDTFRLMELRNPYADSNDPNITEWTGDWSDESNMWERFPYVKNVLGFEPSFDGKFWMSFDDFVRNFRNVYICRLFSNVVDIHNGVDVAAAPRPQPQGQPAAEVETPWFRDQLDLLFAGVPGVTVPKSPELRRMRQFPQFQLQPGGRGRDSIIFISACLLDERPGEESPPLRLVIAKRPALGLPVDELKDNEDVVDATIFAKRETSIDLQLRTDLTYVLVLQVKSEQNRRCRLTAYSRDRFVMSAVAVAEIRH